MFFLAAIALSHCMQDTLVVSGCNLLRWWSLAAVACGVVAGPEAHVAHETKNYTDILE